MTLHTFLTYLEILYNTHNTKKTCYLCTIYIYISEKCDTDPCESGTMKNTQHRLLECIDNGERITEYKKLLP